MKKILTIFAVFYFTTSAFAADVTAWKIVPAQSKINFKVLQGDTNIVGYFKKFDGKINFDKNQLNKSKVTIDVDVSSIVLSLAEASNTAQSLEWLSTKTFPQATFNAEKFSGSGKNFKADGNLTIKGRTVPTSLEFTFEESAPNKAHVVGKTTIKRTAFGVGNRDIKKANGVQDEVEISFVVNAEK